jgi:glycosyltransferase involved in cell wall biosynthesis
MLTHSYYEEDARVRRAAETLVLAGYAVDVFGLRPPGETPEAVIDGVVLHRLGVERHQGAGIGTYLAEYTAFLLRAMVAATVAHRRRRYALLHVHTLPDFLAFAGVPLRLAAGVPILLDLHEAMPEFFRSRFPARASRAAHGSLLLQERASIAVARAVVTVNDALAERLVQLGVAPAKISVILNAPDLRWFDPASQPTRPFMEDGELRLVYAGALTPTYELDVVVDAVARLAGLRPDLPVGLAVYGRGDSEPALRERIRARGLDDRVRLHGRIPLEAVPAAIAAADIGLAPTARSRFTDMSLSTKLFEYAAMGKPVVASALPTVDRYFPPGTVAGYAPGDPDALARAVLALVDDPAGREAGRAATASRAAELSWSHQAARYLGLVERLTASRGARP